jgi:hypothetical protein
MHIASVVDQSFKFRLSIQPRTRPIGTYTYVITRQDDPGGETSAEYFFTREEASTAGRAALDRLLKRRTS